MTKNQTDKPKILATEFARFAKAVLTVDIPDELLERARLVFYSGAGALLTALANAESRDAFMQVLYDATLELKAESIDFEGAANEKKPN